MRQRILSLLFRLVSSLSPDEARTLDKIIHYSLMSRTSSYAEHLHYYYWDNQISSWDQTPIPVRPSRGDIEIYQEFLQKQQNKGRILILGSTPELRDLVAREPNAEVYLADFSYRAPFETLKYTKYADPLKEKWIKANWLELPFPPIFFDLILGDLVLQQFPPALESTFLEKMRSILRSNGAFIGRFHFLDKRVQQDTIGEIAQRILGSQVDELQKFFQLKLRIVWLFADLERRTYRRQLSAQKLNEFLLDSTTQQPLLRRVRDSLATESDSFQNWSCPTEEKLITILSSFFSVIDKKTASDYADAEYYPLFLLRPHDSS